MFSGNIIVAHCVMFIFVVATPFRHRELIIFHILYCLRRSTVFRSKLKNCRVLSSAVKSSTGGGAGKICLTGNLETVHTELLCKKKGHSGRTHDQSGVQGIGLPETFVLIPVLQRHIKLYMLVTKHQIKSSYLSEDHQSLNR